LKNQRDIIRRSFLLSKRFCPYLQPYLQPYQKIFSVGPVIWSHSQARSTLPISPINTTTWRRQKAPLQ